MKRKNIFKEFQKNRAIDLFTDVLSKETMLYIKGGNGEGDAGDEGDPDEDPIIKEDK